ncbi:MAG TPA: ABC transporter ATP-binding protein [Gaiella sp.]|nr:ABC transporter ATP-binding protein [Gaiella sp.]
MALLEIRDLHVSFSTRDGVVHAVDGVSLAVDRGRTLGVVGESGSGKSVTALTVMGLTRLPSATITGEVLLDGVDLLAMPVDELRRVRGQRVAMIFQDPLSSLHPLYKIGWQIVEAIQAHERVPEKAARARALEALREVGIPNALDRLESYPHELSGGMRQRVMIAMALVLDPEILIADEPTTALDVTVQAQILDLVRELQAEHGTAVVLITHDLGVIAETADAVAVMYAGRVVELGPLTGVIDHPEHPYTWGLLQSLPSAESSRSAHLHPIEGSPPSLISVPSGCPFHPRCPYVMDACPREEPALAPTTPNHAVACHLPVATRRAIGTEVRSQGART